MSSIAKLADGRYRARWRTPEGGSRSKTFARKVDAQKHLDSIGGAKLSGSYVDPAAGKVTLAEFAAAWQEGRIVRPTTASSEDVSLRVHVLPVLGKRPIASIRPSELQAFVKTLSATLAPGYRPHDHATAEGHLQGCPARSTYRLQSLRGPSATECRASRGRATRARCGPRPDRSSTGALSRTRDRRRRRRPPHW